MAVWNENESEFDTKAYSDEVGVLATENEDVRSLCEMITYGLKGFAAYSKHANALILENERRNQDGQVCMRTLRIYL